MNLKVLKETTRKLKMKCIASGLLEGKSKKRDQRVKDAGRRRQEITTALLVFTVS